MAKYQDQVETVLAARNEVQGELRQAEQQMKQARQREIQQQRQFAQQQQQAQKRGGLFRGMGTQEKLDLLTGGGAAAAVTALGNQMAQMTAKAEDLAGEFAAGETSVKEMTSELAGTLPIVGGWIRAGQNLRSIFDGSAAALREMEQRAEDGKAANEATARVLEDIDKARFERRKSELGEFQAARLEAEREFQKRREELAKAARAGANREAIAQAREQAERQRDERIDQAREAEAARQRAAEEADRERIRAAREAERGLHQQRLELTGQTLQAELMGIEQAKRKRVRAAQEAGNERLAEVARLEAADQAAAARARDRRDRQQDAIEQWREDAIHQREDLIGDVDRMNARADAAEAPLPQADQRRFLTGVREQTQMADRARADSVRSQEKLAEQQIKRLDRLVAQQDELLQRLEDAPLLRVEDFQN